LRVNGPFHQEITAIERRGDDRVPVAGCGGRAIDTNYRKFNDLTFDLRAQPGRGEAWRRAKRLRRLIPNPLSGSKYLEFHAPAGAE
jgi:hypothetical protein